MSKPTFASDTSFAEWAFITFAVIVVLGLQAMWSGWVLSVLWQWFLVPTFAAPALTVPQAIGLSLILNFMTRSKVESESNRKPLAYFGLLAAGPAFALAIGWIVKQFL